MTASAVIIGGGLAGAAAATLLARSGYPVSLFERQAGPADKVCGEFLSREAQIYLQRLGVDLPALGAAKITHLRLIHRNSTVRVALPFMGMSLSRRCLDEALLAKAVASGAELMRGRAVTPQDVRPTSQSPVLLATGKHDIRAMSRKTAEPSDDLVGFKAYYTLTPRQAQALCGHVEVILFAGGYAGLQMIEGGRSNLCLLVQRARLQRVGFSWPSLLDALCCENAHLRTRLNGAAAVWEKPLAIYRVPYGFVHQSDDRFYRLGDQMGVIDSFSGDGMSIALHSAACAAASVVSGGHVAIYHRDMRRDISGQIQRARWLYQVGQQHSGALLRLARLWPGGLRLATIFTRVPQAALMREGALVRAAA